MRPSCFETPAFDPLVSDTIESFKVPGVAVAIVDGDDISIKVLFLHSSCKLFE